MTLVHVANSLPFLITPYKVCLGDLFSYFQSIENILTIPFSGIFNYTAPLKEMRLSMAGMPVKVGL
jgi:hypothetical protein